MSRQLATIVADFEDLQAYLHRIVEVTPADKWSRRSHPSRWSVAECIAHLNLTSRAFVPLIRTALQEGRRMGPPRPRQYHRGFMGWLIWLMSGPTIRVGRFRLGRLKTAAAFVPAGDLSRDVVVNEFDRLQTEQIGLIRAADGLPLNELRIVSPFDARVRYDVYSALCILPRHQRRHLLQADDVWRSR